MTRRLLDEVTRSVRLPPEADARVSKLTDREWLVTNGIGGYASSSAGCINTRRYHGLLIAALPNPFGRVVMLTHVAETLVAGRQRIQLDDAARVSAFRVDAGLPVWELSAG